MFQFMTEFRFLKVLRGIFFKSCKSVAKTRGGMGVPLSFAVNLLFTTQPQEMLLKSDGKLPMTLLSDGSRSSIELQPCTSIRTATGDSVLLRDCILVSEEF